MPLSMNTGNEHGLIFVLKMLCVPLSSVSQPISRAAVNQWQTRGGGEWDQRVKTFLPEWKLQAGSFSFFSLSDSAPWFILCLPHA